MISRINTNTETLQKQFPHHYRDFFARSQKVASASRSFLWAGDFAGFYGGLTIAQKLPIRVYVGFEITFDDAVTINPDYLTFDPLEQQFITSTLEATTSKTIQRYLEQHFARQKEFTGIKVHLLSELPLGHGLGANGAIAACLALLISPSGTLDKLFQVARDILASSQSGHSSGVSAYASLSDATTPIVFHGHKDGYYAHTIAELGNVAGDPAWPVDFGLIYSGSQANTESVILANNHTVSELEEATKEISQLLDNQLNLNFQQSYINMLNMTSALMATAFVQLFSRGVSTSRLQSLFNTLNQYQNLMHMLDVSNSTTDLLYAQIHHLASQQINDVGSGAKLSGLGKGGVLLFALPYDAHRREVLTLLEQLRKKTGKHIWLDYASWIDGVICKPVLLEQDITNDLVSAFISNDVRVITILHHGRAQAALLTNERFEQLLPSFDLLLDKTTGKIFIAGLAVTSKELPSQKSAVLIMADLIATDDFALKNDQLPGSYGTNRYDLHGKIVLPLQKEVKRITGRDLQLSVQGSMYDNYTLSLNPSNIVIGVVEKKR